MYTFRLVFEGGWVGERERGRERGTQRKIMNGRE